MIIGIPKESSPDETRVAMSPEVAKKLIKKGFDLALEAGAGEKAGFTDSDYSKEKVRIVNNAEALGSPIVFKVQRPNDKEILLIKPQSLLVSFLEPYGQHDTLQKLAEVKVNAMAMELIPRTSRAQSMDALSSQAGIAGYRAVIEAASQFGRF